ncbi:2-oxoglutarate dehydrogenase E1 component [Paludisphaera rhizosphaerae]|uniref:2-oxoglutarate dehydrogenase E1 component n=1 Tax=Paludisphaera rhizosphaerae TaxID=2711216 RepID=UPI0013ED3E79|nr:2-oxoglutarate dehydrogenase E1 component [Paludisphaera rhizosphaerae]
MTRTSAVSRANLDLVEEYQRRWREDPESVDASWRNFFEGYDLGVSHSGPEAEAFANAPPPAQQVVKAVTRLVDAYREMGHNLADLDPLKLTPRRQTDEQLELGNFGLSETDLDREFYSKLGQNRHGTLREIIGVLRETYCRTIGVEFMHIRDLEIRRWLFERMEPVRNHPQFDIKQKRRIIYKLNEAELFETFLHKNFVGQKRFSLEGGEMLIPLLDGVIERSGSLGVQEIVIGMPHRGRLNVLANILHKPYGLIFSEFEGNMPETVAGDGDVKYHLGFSADHVTADKQTVHLTLTPNPSHLEAVDPVVEGRMRAKQRQAKDAQRKLGIPILIHGDAAFAGQGLVAETLNLSQLPGYRTGGTIHIVVNNQIGFTTAPIDARSTRYCTDVAKMIEAPIFHVNGEDPEAVVFVGELATDFRQQFGRDVVIDMVCYRRHGHNEGDEPGFTQPLMYDNIKNRISVREMYTEQLVTSGELSSKEAETIAETFADKLGQVLAEVKREGVEPRTISPGYSSGPWADLTPNFSFTPIETGVSYDVIKQITAVAAATPPGFTPNHKLVRIFQGRVKTVDERGSLDWAHAEALAFGSLLKEGTPVRLSGQDSRRGTFSQRHAVLIDQLTAQPWIPLNNLGDGQAQFCVYDSFLSEAAVLGFDYGYSLDEPNMLIMWEAQFGDFANGAQVIVDQFIASAESKWGRGSGIVMLLPHGYEGQGPEHSSARLERYLQLCAEENIQVCVPSTPAQYFHMLRRQVRRNFRKPLIVMTPKSLLRRKEAVSPVDQLVVGSFRDVLDDPTQPRAARRLILCSGKVYYDLAAKRAEAGKDKDVAIVRVEQLYPFPAEELKKTLLGYPEVRDWVWAQEESQNMGAWSFIAPRLEELMGFPFQYVGRDASASPATGSKLIHDREQNELVEAAVGAAVPHLVCATPVRALAAAGSREGAR